MSVRDYQPVDENAIQNIIKEISSSETDKAPLLSPAAFNWNSENIRDELQKAHTLVLVQDEKVAAFLCYREAGEALDITVLATAEKNRRMGLQSLLVNELKSRNQKAKWPIILEVHEENLSAVKFYSSLGFVEISKRKRYYSDGASAIVMQFLF